MSAGPVPHRPVSIPETFRKLQPAARAYLYGSAFMGAAQAVTWSFLTRWLNVQGYSKTEIGTFQSLDSWGKVAVALPAAFLLARRPARGVFVLSALIAGIVYIALPHLPSLRWMYAANFIAGLAMTVHYVAIAPFLFRHTGAAERAGVFSLAEAARTLAAVVGAGLAGFVVARLAGPMGGEIPATNAVISGAGACSLIAALFYARIDDSEPSMPVGSRVLPVVRQNAALLARFAAPQFVIACGAGFCIPFLPTYFQERFDVAGRLGLPVRERPGAHDRGLPHDAVHPHPARLREEHGRHRALLAALLPRPRLHDQLPVAMFAFLMRGALMNATHPIIKNLMMQATPAGARRCRRGSTPRSGAWGGSWARSWRGACLTRSDDYAVLMCTTVGLYLFAAVLTWTMLRGVERGGRERRGGPEASGGGGSG